MRMVVGVIGHVDHGKTALVRALTGMETDRLAEEQRRGISITLGFAHFTAGDATIDLIDMPGHERFVRTMVSGATGVDAALMVVAANEGIKPQTVEHLDIAGLLGVARVVVAVSKADLVDAAQAEATAREASALAQGIGMKVCAAVLTSTATGQGIEALRTALAALPTAEASGGDGFPYLPIDRVFSVPGHGTVVTGTLRRGPLGVTDDVAAAPGGRPIRLRSLQVHGVRTDTALPGQRVAANLRDIEPGELSRGMALTAQGLLPASAWLTVALRGVDGAPPLATGARLMLLFGTEEVEARLRLLDREALEPGQTALAQLQCARPVAAPARERFILRRVSPPQTVAGGRVIDPAASRLRRHAPALLAHLAVLAEAAPARVVQAELAAAGAAGVPLKRLAVLAGVSAVRAAALLGDSTVLARSGVAVLRAAFDQVAAAIPGVLAAQGRDLPPDRLSALLPWVGRAVLEEAVAGLARQGVLVRAGGSVRLHVPDQDRARATQEAESAGLLAETLRQAGLSPPNLYNTAPGPQNKRLVDRLVKDGVLVRTYDKVQKREVVFHRDAVETAKRLLVPLLAEPPGILVGEAGAALGISRKYCVPLLEHLDAVRFTRRVADRRMLMEGGR